MEKLDDNFENKKIKPFDTQEPADAFEKFQSFFVIVRDNFHPLKWSKNQSRMRPIYKVREMARIKNGNAVKTMQTFFWDKFENLRVQFEKESSNPKKNSFGTNSKIVLETQEKFIKF